MLPLKAFRDALCLPTTPGATPPPLHSLLRRHWQLFCNRLCPNAAAATLSGILDERRQSTNTPCYIENVARLRLTPPRSYNTYSVLSIPVRFLASSRPSQWAVLINNKKPNVEQEDEVEAESSALAALWTQSAGLFLDIKLTMWHCTQPDSTNNSRQQQQQQHHQQQPTANGNELQAVYSSTAALQWMPPLRVVQAYLWASINLLLCLD